MDHNILLVDDQRDILRLLRSSLDTLEDVKLKMFECQSGEEALLESSRHKIDLLVTDYKLPGMTGLQLIHKIRARHPEAKVILISGVTDNNIRKEMINAGALAIFEKPVSVMDFLDAVERGLGLVETIFAPELKAELKVDETKDDRPVKLSDLLINFRQDVNAEAVLLINDRGFVQARTGKLRDDSLEMETALVDVMMSIHYASLKVARYTRQEALSSYHVYSGGDYDLLLAPVNTMYALLVVGNGIAAKERLLENVGNMVALRNAVEKSLKSIGKTGELLMESKKAMPVSAATASPTIRLTRPVEVIPSPEMEALLKGAADKKVQISDTDDFWSQAAEKHGNRPANSEVISLEEARKLGLIPGDGK